MYVKNGMYYVREIVVVGYGRSQVYMVKCSRCGKLQLPDTDHFSAFCDDCQVKLTYRQRNNTVNKDPERWSPVYVVGRVIGWQQRTDAYKKRSYHNYKKVYRRDDYTCRYCGYSPKKCEEFIPLSIDHIFPHAAGGGNVMSNLVVACMTCNQIVTDNIFTSFFDKRVYVRSTRREKGLLLYDLLPTISGIG